MHLSIACAMDTCGGPNPKIVSYTYTVYLSREPIPLSSSWTEAGAAADGFYTIEVGDGESLFFFEAGGRFSYGIWVSPARCPFSSLSWLGGFPYSNRQQKKLLPLF